MVELRYGDYHEVADLAGKSIAEVREEYKPLLNIPNKTKTKLNGKAINRKHESDTTLKDNDELRFVEKSNKVPFFTLAMLLALGATAIPFAFAQTTESVSVNATSADADFVTVTASSSLPTWNVFGKFKGTCGSGGELFRIQPASGFTSDLSCTVIFGNADQLVETYRVLVMKLSIYEGSSTSANQSAKIGNSEYLTLGKGEVDFTITGYTQQYLWVYLDSGFYITHYWGGWTPGGYEDPTLFCDVTQKGT